MAKEDKVKKPKSCMVCGALEPIQLIKVKKKMFVCWVCNEKQKHREQRERVADAFKS